MRTKSYLWLIFLVALILRLAATRMFEGLHEGPRRTGFSDGVEFNQLAGSLVQRGEYAYEPGQPTAFRAPGFPFLLAGIYCLTGVNNFLAFHIVQSLLGAALVFLVFAIARDVANERVGLIAAGLAALYPNLLYYTIHFSSEPLFTLLLTGTVWLILRAARNRTASTYALAGLALGLAALTRPLAFYLLPLFIVAMIWRTRHEFRQHRLGLVLFAVATLLPIAPWTYRNYRAFDRFLMFASNGGSTLWGSNNALVLEQPDLHGQWISTERMPEQKAQVKQLPNEVDRDRLEGALGKQFLREHVGAIPRLTWYKFQEFWTPFCKTPNRKFNRIILISYAPLLPLMVIGLCLFGRTSRAPGDLILLLTPVVGTVLGTLVFYGSARFRSTVEPVLLIFVAVCVVWLADYFCQRCRDNRTA